VSNEGVTPEAEGPVGTAGNRVPSAPAGLWQAWRGDAPRAPPPSTRLHGGPGGLAAPAPSGAGGPGQPRPCPTGAAVSRR